MMSEHEVSIHSNQQLLQSLEEEKSLSLNTMGIKYDSTEEENSMSHEPVIDLQATFDSQLTGLAFHIPISTCEKNISTIQDDFVDVEDVDVSCPIVALDGSIVQLGTNVVQFDGNIVQLASSIAENEESVVEKQTTIDLVDGQAVQLENGTTAVLSNTPRDGFQAVQLEDGTTAYLSLSESPLLESSLAFTLTPEQLVTINGDDENSIAIDIDQSNAEDSGLGDLFIGSDRTFKCQYDGCGKLYTTIHHMKVHERSHTGDRPFKCDVEGCLKTFSTGYGLKSHTRTHTGEKPYKCPDSLCEKSFKTSGDLQKHMRTHTGERPFLCPIADCGRSFTTSNIRKVHLRTHTGERPYVCNISGCRRAFASATNFKNHQRIHTGEKPYICTFMGCGKRFTEYSSLYKHHVVHTHQKPYICDICGRHYRQPSTVTLHKRQCHADMLQQVELSSFLVQSAPTINTTSSKRSKKKGEKTILQTPTSVQFVGVREWIQQREGGTSESGGIDSPMRVLDDEEEYDHVFVVSDQLPFPVFEFNMTTSDMPILTSADDMMNEDDTNITQLHLSDAEGIDNTTEDYKIEDSVETTDFHIEENIQTGSV